ncbi:MAG: DUF1801 domain-containing protein [Hyphomicrobiaceae bacterium]
MSPKIFLSTIKEVQRREDGLCLLPFFDRVTRLKPRMWGTSIVGYGRYAYKYESGHAGEYFLTGFSPRKKALSIYVMPGYQDMSDLLVRLGKHKTGKSCLYINRLSDIDLDILREVVVRGLSYMRTNYQTWES